jgi:hypothetical protein
VLVTEPAILAAAALHDTIEARQLRGIVHGVRGDEIARPHS